MPILSLVLIAALAASPAFAQAQSPERQQALQHLREGQRLMNREAFEEAEQEFRAAIKLDPLLVMAHYGLGQAQMNLKEYPEAVKAYVGCREAFHAAASASVNDRLAFEKQRDDQLRALRDTIRELQQNQPPPTTPAGVRVAMQIQRLQLQIDALDRLRDLGKGGEVQTPAEISLALGSAYFRGGQLDDAEREYRAALEARPKLGEAHNNLAVVYLMTGRPELAEEQVKLAEKAGFRVASGLKQDIEKALEAQ